MVYTRGGGGEGGSGEKRLRRGCAGARETITAEPPLQQSSTAFLYRLSCLVGTKDDNVGLWGGVGDV